jgi:hypothetical protein
MYLCPIPNGFRDRTVTLYSSLDALGRATRHVLTRVVKCIDVDGEIFEYVLYCTSYTIPTLSFEQ